MFGFPETRADSPGSIMSTEGGAHQTGYFDQQPYFSGSSSAATSPHAGVGLYHQQQMQQQQVNTSAPSTPVACLGGSGNNSSNNGASSLSRSPGSTSIWGSLAQQGSQSSPPTPSVTPIAGRTTGMAANMVAPNLMSGAEGEGFQRRLLEEQKRLHDAQQQEQQKLQLAQQWELEQMQRHQQEDQARHQQHQHMQFQHSPPSAAPIHHDHNDPATWGSYNNGSAVGARGAGQFTGYLGGNGKGYTPAAIGGVAALAAVSAMAASRHTPTNGHRSDSGMEMDF